MMTNQNQSLEKKQIDIQQIQQMEKAIRESENSKIVCETQLNNCRQQFQAIDQEIKSLGIDPQALKTEILALEQKIIEEYKLLETLVDPNLPQKIQNELNKPIEIEELTVDFELEF